MSQIVDAFHNDEIQFVLDDSDMIFQPSQVLNEEPTDIILADGTRAVLLNSELLNGDTLVLQEDEQTSFIFDENRHVQFLTDESFSNTNTLVIPEDYEINEEYTIAAENSEGSNVLLVENFLPEQDQNNCQFQFENLFTNSEEFSHPQFETHFDKACQFAILKDGKISLQPYDSTEQTFINQTVHGTENHSEVINNDSKDQKNLPLSTVTGKDMITGETITLHKYMDRKSNKGISRNVAQNKVVPKDSETALKSLINKELPLGRIEGGKRLIGKIIEVKKKEDTQNHHEQNNENANPEIIKVKKKEDTENNNEQTDENTDPETTQQIISFDKIVSSECFKHISNTLSGLMNIDNVAKHLECKDIFIKVIDKYIDRETNENRIEEEKFCSGIMIKEYIIKSEEDHFAQPSWRFIPSSDIKEAVFGDEALEDGIDELCNIKYDDVSNVTVVITHQSCGKQELQVIFNTKTVWHCPVCYETFPTNAQLKSHTKAVHGSHKCELCDRFFDTLEGLKRHKKSHSDNKLIYKCKQCNIWLYGLAKFRRHENLHLGKGFECSKCLQQFPTASSLSKHLIVHTDGEYRCDICGHQFYTTQELTNHKITHPTIKVYECKTCGRQFSRHSNLVRHVAIHKGAGAAYTCSVCGCAYHYISSLTRHMVQSHLPSRDQTETEDSQEEIIETCLVDNMVQE